MEGGQSAPFYDPNIVEMLTEQKEANRLLN